MVAILSLDAHNWKPRDALEKFGLDVGSGDVGNTIVRARMFTGNVEPVNAVSNT